MKAQSHQAARDRPDACPADAVAHLKRQLRDAQEQVRRLQQLATLGTLAAMVAHEFNNILTPIQSYAQLACEHADPDIRDKAVRHALEGAGRAAAICRALLDLAGRDADEPQTVHLAELVQQTLVALVREPAKDGIRLIRQIPPRLRLKTRPAELKQVLLNLLLNARRAVLEKRRGQSIVIAAQQAGPDIRIRVADTGVGIRPENLHRIFEPFFSPRPGGGAGLGLAVCRHIVAGMNGRLTVRSQFGKGTCFTLSVPADAARTAAAGACPKRQTASAAG